jgi:serine/threonine protein kinase
MCDMRFQQSFARKIFRGHVSDKEIRGETRAIDALRSGGHGNLVSILRHGWLPSKSEYFIDMELCHMNLGEFIEQQLDWEPFRCRRHPNYLVKESFPIWWRTPELLRVIFQIVSGVVFIHKCQQVHRDLKPQNGWAVCFSINDL